MAGINIVDHVLGGDAYSMFTVTIVSHTVQTIVTSNPSVLSDWIAETTCLHGHMRDGIIVGLDIEWRPNVHRNQNNPAATLQLCVGGRCVIFQFIYAPSIPQTLREFLASSRFTFVGVKIAGDVEKLMEDYNLAVTMAIDLGNLASTVLGNAQLRSAGLKTLARMVLGLEISKPERVTRSRWDVEWLSLRQIQYACVDAFVSMQIGCSLMNTGNFFL